MTPKCTEVDVKRRVIPPRCSECGKVFQPRSSTQKTCGRECSKQRTLERQRRWVSTHPDSRRVSEKKYRTLNQEAVRARARAYYAANKTELLPRTRVAAARYKAANRAKINAERRSYYVENREERLAYARAYRLENRGKKRAWTKQYTRLNISFPGMTPETFYNLKKKADERSK